MEEKKCRKCAGCGQVADSKYQEPWTAWLRLPPGRNAAIVKPITCDQCNGTGTWKDLAEAVFESLGAASMCWDSPWPSGTFDGDQAKAIGESLIAYIEKRYVLVDPDMRNTPDVVKWRDDISRQVPMLVLVRNDKLVALIARVRAVAPEEQGQ